MKKLFTILLVMTLAVYSGFAAKLVSKGPDFPIKNTILKTQISVPFSISTEAMQAQKDAEIMATKYTNVKGTNVTGNGAYAGVDRDVNPIAYEPYSGYYFYTNYDPSAVPLKLQLIYSTNSGTSWIQKTFMSSANYHYLLPSIVVQNPHKTKNIDSMVIVINTVAFGATDGKYIGSHFILQTGNPSDGIVDIPNEAPMSNTTGYNYANGATRLNYSAKSQNVYGVFQVDPLTANDQYGLYGYSSINVADGSVNSGIPASWGASIFKDPGGTQSSWNSPIYSTTDNNGNIYATVDDVIPDASPEERRFAISKSTDNGTSWSDFNNMKMPSGFWDEWAVSQGYTNAGTYLVYDSGDGFIANGVDNLSRVCLVGLDSIDATTKQSTKSVLLIAEVQFNNGNWTINPISEVQGSPRIFSSTNTLDGNTLTGNALLYQRPNGSEIEIAKTADGTQMIAKWVDYRTPLDSTAFGNDLTIGVGNPAKTNTLSQQYQTDVYMAYSTIGSGVWSKPINVTNDAKHNKASRIPSVVKSISEIPMMTLQSPPAANSINSNDGMLKYYTVSQITQPVSDMIYVSFQFAMFTKVSLGGTDVQSDLVDYGFAFNEVYPNPASDITSILFNLNKESEVKIELYNMLGQKLSNIYNGHLGYGSFTKNFDASNLSSGMYLITITVDGHSLSKNLNVIR